MDDNEKEFLNNKDEFRTQDESANGKRFEGLAFDNQGTVTKAENFKQVQFLNDEGNVFN